ncbi:hypothetical protein Csa_018369, partial [Cucumis sativus]
FVYRLGSICCVSVRQPPAPPALRPLTVKQRLLGACREPNRGPQIQLFARASQHSTKSSTPVCSLKVATRELRVEFLPHTAAGSKPTPFDWAVCLATSHQIL